MPLRTLRQLDFAQRRVLLRADLNVPLDPQLHIRDDLRIRASLPTLQTILKRGGRVIAMSHLGDPRSVDPALSLRPVADRLEQLLEEPVDFVTSGVGPEVEPLIARSSARVLLLENLRFHPGEKAQDPLFVEQLAQLGELYVNDAFGTAHRSDSSCVALAKAFPSRAAAGLLLEKEVCFLTEKLQRPTRPFVAIVGGAKVSSKIGVLERLLERCDRLVIVGAMAYTFLLARGIEVGSSLHEPEWVPHARQLLEKAAKGGKVLLLPSDLIVASSLEPDSLVRLVPSDRNLPKGFQGVDIGPQTVAAIEKLLEGAATLFWNGPAGIFEQPRFAKGTRAIAEQLAQHPGVRIVGGGDSAAAIAQMGLADRFDHVSTGGGASLELIEKGDLPALAALREAY